MIHLEPDIIERPSWRLILDLERGLIPKSAWATLMRMALEPTITNILIRLKKVQILNIHEPFYDKAGEIYLVTSVNDGLIEKPIVLDVKTFSGVEENDFLDIGKPGIAIYQNPPGKLPRFLDIRIQIVESDKGLRDAGKVLTEISNDQDFKDTQKVLSTLATTATPMLSTVVDLTDKVINIVGGILKMNQDDQICYYAATFTDKFDNLGVGQHRHTKPHEVEFSYEILASRRAPSLAST